MASIACAPGTKANQTPTRSKSGLRKGLLVKAILLAVVVMVLAEVLRIFVGSNFHCVAPGRCYRSAQPTADLLANVQRSNGICTIINLRGNDNENEAWFQEESAAAKRLGIELLGAGLSSMEQAPAMDFRIFVQAMKDAKEPILIHCANGNDRSGLASAVYLLMRTETPLPVARKQFSLRYGHFAVGQKLCLHRVLDNYETWLNGRPHTSEQFYFWGMNVYEPEVVK
jgi:protein tyrosine phosphatase (PTP) superfamily phosphohydrolase (DUF442 family)